MTNLESGNCCGEFPFCGCVDEPTCPYCYEPIDEGQEVCGSAGCRREKEQEERHGR